MDINTFTSQFSQLFENTDPALIQADTEFRSLEEWDSLIALSIIAMVDEHYGVTLSGEDIRSAKTVRQLFELVQSKKSN
jgi:acyl carrier protein